jgi:hypothetical protein
MDVKSYLVLCFTSSLIRWSMSPLTPHMWVGPASGGSFAKWQFRHVISRSREITSSRVLAFEFPFHSAIFLFYSLRRSIPIFYD